MASITLFDLSTSRSIRTAWLLEELSVPYELVHAERDSNGLADRAFKEKAGTIQGKAPALGDDTNDVLISESGAIAEYLCEVYDPKHRLVPTSIKARSKVREFMHAAEGTMMMHALPVVYAKRLDAQAAKPLVSRMPAMVCKDLDWLEEELERKGGGWLVGDDVTAADTMMGFSLQCIFTNRLAGEGVDATEWKRIKQWLDLMEGREAYQRAVRRTTYRLKSLI